MLKYALIIPPFRASLPPPLNALAAAPGRLAFLTLWSQYSAQAHFHSIYRGKLIIPGKWLATICLKGTNLYPTLARHENLKSRVANRSDRQEYTFAPQAMASRDAAGRPALRLAGCWRYAGCDRTSLVSWSSIIVLRSISSVCHALLPLKSFLLLPTRISKL